MVVEGGVAAEEAWELSKIMHGVPIIWVGCEWPGLLAAVFCQLWCHMMLFQLSSHHENVGLFHVLCSLLDALCFHRFASSVSTFTHCTTQGHRFLLFMFLVSVHVAGSVKLYHCPHYLCTTYYLSKSCEVTRMRQKQAPMFWPPPQPRPVGSRKYPYL